MRDMRALIQRVKWAKVETGQETVASIGQGLLVLLGFSGEDSATMPETLEWSRFLSMMEVSLCHWGPVTIWLDNQEML